LSLSFPALQLLSFFSCFAYPQIPLVVITKDIRMDVQKKKSKKKNYKNRNTHRPIHNLTIGASRRKKRKDPFRSPFSPHRVKTDKENNIS